MATKQTDKNKKGEVTFRKKLAQQFAGKTTVYHGEPSAVQYGEILKDRIRDYAKYFNILKKKRVFLTPYLEIGAGVGQGGMLLENNYGVSGFVTDISYETLVLAPKYKKELRFRKMPVRIACDLYNLPFQTGSIPFIFTFQTLHHLPDPLPAFLEFKRVLSPKGYFYFDEEPVAQVFNLNLWRRDRNLRWFEKVLKLFVVLHFISRIGRSEIEHNILEETFTLKIWEKALSVFSVCHARLTVFPFQFSINRTKTKNAHWLRPPFFKNLLLQTLGGGIGALCQNTNGRECAKTPTLFDTLACPQCASKPRLSFEAHTETLSCATCKAAYKKINGVYLLFSKEQMNKFYPEYL